MGKLHTQSLGGIAEWMRMRVCLFIQAVCVYCKLCVHLWQYWRVCVCVCERERGWDQKN